MKQFLLNFLSRILKILKECDRVLEIKTDLKKNFVL